MANKIIKITAAISIVLFSIVAKAAPLPTVAGNANPSPLIGESACFNADFSNTGGSNPATDIGYGPYYQLILKPDISLDSTGFFGSSIHTLVGTFPAAPGNQLTDPFSNQLVTGQEGGQLFVLEIPIGSVAQGQPALSTEICLTVNNNNPEVIDPANHSVVGVTIVDAVTLVPGFQFGDQPTGAMPIVSAALASTITPEVVRLFVNDTQPEGEIPPGETYAWPVNLQAVVAVNKTVIPTPPATSVDFPLYILPFNVDIVDVGAPGPDITLPAGCSFAYTAPVFATQTNGSLLVSCASLTATTDINFEIYKVDTLDPMSCNSDPSGTPISTAKHVSLIKSVSNQSIPGSTVSYTLNIRLSEFLTAANGTNGVDVMSIEDVMPDGVTFDAGFTPEISLNGGAFSAIATGFVDGGELGDGTRILTFDVLAALGTGALAALDVVTVRYQAAIDQTFTAPAGPVLGRDILTNNVLMTYDIEGAANGKACTDDSAATITIADVTTSKQIVAINGVAVTGNVDVTAGDEVTFRLRLNIPSGDLDGVIFNDYFPLPIFDATAINTSTTIASNPDIEFTAASTLTNNPASITSDAATNALIINWGDFTAASNQILEIDVRATVSTAPFVDGLALVNFMQAESNNSVFDMALDDAIVNFTVSAPEVEIVKTIESVPALPDTGDAVSYRIRLTELNAVAAFNITVSDSIPAGLSSCSLDAASALLGSGDIFGAGFDLNQTIVMPAMAASSVIDLVVNCTIDTGAGLQAGETITNISSVVWNGDFNETALYPENTSEVDLVLSEPDAFKEIITTSESHTSDTTGDTNATGDRRPLVIGEIVRFRLWANLPEGISSALQMRDLMPAGFQFVNDGSTTVAFVSTVGGNVTSTTAICAGGTLNYTGNETTLSTITPDCIINAGVISGGSGSGGAFQSGNDPRFSLGNISNSENDADQEFVVIELNAVLLDEAINVNGTTASNRAQVRLSVPLPGGGTATRSDNSSSVFMEVVAPLLSITKTVNPSVADLNQLLTFTLTVQHISGSATVTDDSAAHAFDIVLSDIVPAGYTYTAASLISNTPAICSVIDDSDPTDAVAGVPNGLQVTMVQLPLAAVCEVGFTATVNAGVSLGSNTVNTAILGWSSLPGDGSDVAAGNNTGSDIASFPALTEHSATANGISNTLTDPELGVAKDLTALTDNGDGTFTASFSIVVENSGNLLINDLQVTDDLAATFLGATNVTITSGPSSGVLLVNSAYDGNADINLLLAGNSLPVGATASIDFSVRFNPAGLNSFNNQATGSGQTPGGILVNDLSTDGTLTDPDTDGDPNNNSAATPIQLSENPQLAVAKISSPAISIGGGLFETVISINLENIGNTQLANVQLIDNLNTTFAGVSSFSVTTLPVVTGSSTLNVNTAYDGNTDIHLLNQATSFLAVGEQANIQFSVQFNPTGGVQPFNNTATGSAYLPATDPNTNPPDTSDDSDHGTDGDPNGDGNPAGTGEDDPTPISTTANAIIGLAKSASATVSVAGGQHETTITLTLENLGNTNLTNVQVIDDLTNVFTGTSSIVSVTAQSVSTVGSSALNLGTFNGVADINLLSGSDTLLVGDTATIQFTVRFDPGTESGPFLNSATANSDASGGVSDTSDNGTKTDSDGDFNPDEAGENDATPIHFGENPVIAVAKNITSTDFLTGTNYRTSFSIRLENLGNVDLNNVQITESLLSAFPAPATFVISAAPTITTAPATGSLQLNTGFDGSSDTDLLTATGSDLPIGEFSVIELTVDFDTSGSQGPFFNQVLASALSPTSVSTTDLSDEGTETDSNSDNNPAGPGEDDPSVVSLNEQPIVGVSKQAGPVTDNGDGSFTVPFTFIVENFGNVDLNSVQVNDDLNTTFGAANFTVVSGPTSGSLTVNLNYDGDADSNLLVGNDLLLTGSTATIEISVMFTPAPAVTDFNNQASVSALSPGSLPVNDLSQEGANPDPDGDNIPNNNNAPTAFTIVRNGVVGLAKTASPAIDIGGGLFETTITLTIENLGNEALFNVQIIDDLNTVMFAAADSFTVTSTPVVVGLGTLTANSLYDGNADTNLLQGALSTLAVGESGSISFTVQFDPAVGIDSYAGTATTSAYLAGVDPNTNPADTTDISDNGINTDSDGDGNPNEAGENDPTVVSITATPIVAIAKMAAPTETIISDVRYRSRITLTIENLGNADLTAIQVVDNLATVFTGTASVISVTAPVITVSGSSVLVTNAGFDGLGNNNLLSGGDTLLVGDSASISFDIVFEPNAESGPFNNSAVASSTAGGGVVDTSDDGTVTDADGDGNPDEAGENDVTPITFGDKPVIGVAKSATSAVLQTGTTYRTTFTLILENLGNVNLSDVQLAENLLATFPAPGNFNIVTPPTISVLPASGSLTINPLYNGNNDANLLTAASSSLAVGDRAEIELTVDFDTQSSSGPFFNQVQATAEGPDGSMTSDLSDNGSLPDSNNNNNPSDSDESDPTPVLIQENPILGVAKVAGAVTPLGNGDFSIPFTLFIENMGDTELRNLQVSDDLSTTFGADAFIVTVTPTSASLTVNANYDGVSTGDINLLSGSDTLAAGATATVTMTVSFTPATPTSAYTNQASTTATTPNNVTLTDLSQDGNNSDPDSNNEPRDNNDATPFSVSVIPAAQIGLAKTASPAIALGGGLFETTITLNIENLGSATLLNVLLKDDLATTFAGATDVTVSRAPVVTGSSSIFANAAYDGNADTDVLMVGSSANVGPSVLATGQTASIVFDVQFNPSGAGPFNNTATAQAYLQGTDPVTNPPDTTDDSDHGSNADPDGDGNPNEAGENDPTPIDTAANAVIGLSKSASVSTEVGLNYRSTITLRIENLGNTDLTDVQVVDDLNSVFIGTASVISVTAPVVTASGSSSLTSNAGFDGIANTNLLSGSDTLLVGETATITFDIEFSPGAEPGPFLNSANAASTAGGGVTDISDDGSNSDADGDGNPNETGENDASPINFGDLPVIAAAKSASNPISLGATRFSSVFTFTVENLGNVELSNVQLIENLLATFPAPASFSVVSAATVSLPPATGNLSINPAFNGTTDKNLLLAQSSHLPVGERARIQLTVEFDTQGNLNPFFNQALASAESPSGVISSDLSDDGSNPDSNGNNNPADFGEDTPTAVLAIPPAHLTGIIWVDENHDRTIDGSEPRLEGWLLELFDPFGTLLGTTTTDTNGHYSFSNLPVGSGNSIRLRHPETNVIWGEISNVQLNPGETLLEQNLPIDPQGVFYNAVTRQPIPGVTLTIVNVATGNALPTACFLDASQQNQTTGSDGFYRFDLVPGADAGCPAVATEYAMQIDQPVEFNVPPSSLVSGLQTGALDAANCPLDAVPATAICEVQAQTGAPQSADATTYFFNFILGPGVPDVVNNHIPLDFLDGAVSLIKLVNPGEATTGGFAVYTLRAINNLPGALTALDIVDDIPAGFSYVNESAQLVRAGADALFNTDDDIKIAATVSGSDPLIFSGINMAAQEEVRINYLLRVSIGVAPGHYVNTAEVQINGTAISNSADATVRVIADPLVGKTTIIGKVFHDRDEDGWQDHADASGVLVQGGFDPAAYIAGSTMIDRGDGQGLQKLDDRSAPLVRGISVDLPGRINEADKVNRVIIQQRIQGDKQQILKDLQISSEQGSNILYKANGSKRVEHTGEMKAGMVSQDLRVTHTLEPINKKLQRVTEQVTEYEAFVSDKAIEVIHFSSGKSMISADFYKRVNELLEEYKDKRNLRLHFVGHTDNQQLSKRAAKIFVDNNGLSKARAKQVAEYVRKHLQLSADIISYDGKGFSQPLASNATPQGMLQNRRVELQLTYDKAVTRDVHKVISSSDAEQWIYTVRVENHGINEEGLPGVRVATATGLLIETDAFGRYHVADIELANLEIGHNVILKVDDSTLPAGSVFTTENPRVQRLTSSLMNEYNFGVKLPAVTAWQQTVLVCKNSVEQDVQAAQLSTGTNKQVRVDNLIEPVRFASGQSLVTQEYLDHLQAVILPYKDKANVRLNFIGHTDNERLSKRAADKYGDNKGLSKMRAKRVSNIVVKALELSDAAIKFEGRGESQPIAKNNTAAGMALNRRVEIELIYDQPQLAESTQEDIENNCYNDNFKNTSINNTVNTLSSASVKSSANRQSSQTVLSGTEEWLSGAGVVWVTEDPAINDPRLDIKVTSVAFAENGQLIEPIKFHAYTNYQAFIDRWQLRIYKDSDRDLIKPVATLEGESLVFSEAIIWDGSRSDELWIAGERLVYQLRVYDSNGYFDETAPRVLQVMDTRMKKLEEETANDEAGHPAYAIYGQNNLLKQNIPISGSRVRITGREIGSDFQIVVNGSPIVVDKHGQFVHEEHLPLGKQAITVSTQKDNKQWNREYNIDVSGKHIFMVGLANLTIGENNVNGNVELLSGDEHFDGDIFTDGRLAFYLKGKIKGKYLITAQLDTTYDDLDNLSDNLKRRNPDRLFRRLDPDQFYPVYGDDSKTISDVDTQGAMYVRVDWDKSLALWGNYDTGITGNEFAHYNRTLYGAQLVYNSNAITKYGDARDHVNIFASEPESAAGHNRFTATGGSLYYLQQSDIVQGSEKIWVEIIKRDTQQVQEVRTLLRGRDYEIDYLQGRIILAKPLLTFAYSDTNAIVKDKPLDGDDVYLQVDFEYVPIGFDGDDLTVGARLHTWVTDEIGVGVSRIQESRNSGDDYELKAVDITYRAGKGTYLKLEGAQSKNDQSRAAFTSDDGGLTFTARPLGVAGTDSTADAIGAELQVNFAELSETHNGYAKVWYKQRDAGFSSSRTETTTADTHDVGVEVSWQAGEDLTIGLRGNEIEQEAIRTDTTASLQGDYQFTNRLNAGMEVRYDEDDTTASGGIVSESTTVGARLKYQADADTQYWGTVQSVVADNENAQENDLASVGVDKRINDKFSLGAEVSSGDRGDALLLKTDFATSENFTMQLEAGVGSGAQNQVAANYALDNGYELYGSYSIDPDHTEGQKSTTTLGQRKRFGNSVTLFMENQFTHAEQESGVGHIFGLDFGVGKHWHWSSSLQHSNVEQNDGVEIDRDVLTLGMQYRSERLRFGSKLEYRVDDASDGDEITQWLTTNKINYRASESWRWLSKLNYSITESDVSNIRKAKFTEFDLGFAYRPIKHHRLNLLGKYSFLYDLGSEAQFKGSITDPTLLGPDPDERANILSLDAIYDITKRWEIGGKLAVRRGDLRLDRGTGPWFKHGVDLAIIRGRYHFVKRWDAMLEYRWLRDSEIKDVKQGALAGIYLHLNKHIKLGVGYNFTDYSDNLKDINYDSQGWFIDIVGKY